MEERRAALEKLIPSSSASPLRFSSAFAVEPAHIPESACAMSLEGVIGKRMGSLYTSRRNADWIKLKCRQRQEFVIVGYTKPKGSRTGFGALLLGVHKEGNRQGLVYAGRVGTGFNQSSLRQLHRQLASLEIKESPLESLPAGRETKDVHWVQPSLVCEAEFAEWTQEGLLRQASFIALRADKPAKDIVRERATSPSRRPVLSDGPARDPGHTSVDKVRITHPDRVIDPQSGASKLDLALFYHGISE